MERKRERDRKRKILPFHIIEGQKTFLAGAYHMNSLCSEERERERKRFCNCTNYKREKERAIHIAITHEGETKR